MNRIGTPEETLTWELFYFANIDNESSSRFLNWRAPVEQAFGVTKQGLMAGVAVGSWRNLLIDSILKLPIEFELF